MKEMDKVVEVIRKLRAPDGCPWDKEQTHKSLRGHLVEECAELLECIDNQDYPAMEEELGDILLHVAFHAQIADENNKFTFSDIAEKLADKLIRRHPHVFADTKAENSQDVLKIWNDVKTKENKPKLVGSLFDGIAPDLSALRTAYDISKKISAKEEEKVSSLKNLNKSQEFGKAIFDVVKDCVDSGIEPEGALRDFILLIKETLTK